MTREEQINKSCNDLLKGAGIDELERLKLGLWYKMGAKFADDNPKEGVNWQQVRIQAAIAVMKGLISNPDDFTTIQSPSGIAKKSILFADALVKELKGE